MRPVSSAHAMLGIASRLIGQNDIKKEVTNILKTSYDRVISWNNKQEIISNAGQLVSSLDDTISLL